MNVDIQKLKALAEAAPAGPWYPPDEYSHKGMVFDCDLGSLLSYESIDTERDACVTYVAAANPAAVLELIAEIERLKWKLDEESDRVEIATDLQRKAMNGRDHAKAENEALRVCVETLALSLECEVNARYAGTQEHLAIKRKYDGDMQEVIDARALLNKEPRP